MQASAVQPAKPSAPNVFRPAWVDSYVEPAAMINLRMVLNRMRAQMTAEAPKWNATWFWTLGVAEAAVAAPYPEFALHDQRAAHFHELVPLAFAMLWQRLAGLLIPPGSTSPWPLLISDLRRALTEVTGEAWLAANGSNASNSAANAQRTN